MPPSSQEFVEELERLAERRPRSQHLGLLRQLYPFLAPYRGTIILAGIALVVAATATLVMPTAVRGMIDNGFSVANAGRIGQYFLLLIGVCALLGAASAYRFYLVTWIGERVVANIRNKVFSHILSLSPSFFETTRTGEICRGSLRIQR